MKIGGNSFPWKGMIIVPLIGTIMLLVVWVQKPDGRLRVWVLDVGQGNAVLVRTPQGHTAVIDGGLEATPLNEGIGRNVPFWQHGIDLVVVSSPKAENITGLVDLMGRREVKEVVQTNLEVATSVQGAWREAVAQSSTQVHFARRGDVIRFEGEPEVVIRVVYPVGESEGEDGPVAMRIEYEGVGILLAGTLERTDELRLMGVAAEGELASDVLVVPDHGSEGLAGELIGAVGPKVAVISVGAGNRGGDPAPGVLQGLLSVGARVWRTDVDGSVEVIVDHGELWVGSEK